MSPLFASNLKGLPKMLIQVGDDESAARRFDCALADVAEARPASTVTLDVHRMGLWHVWQVMAGWMPEADQAVADIAAFINR